MMAMANPALIRAINAAIEQQHLRLQDLCRQTGIPYSTLGAALRGVQGMSNEHWRAVCKEVHVDYDAIVGACDDAPEVPVPELPVPELPVPESPAPESPAPEEPRAAAEESNVVALTPAQHKLLVESVRHELELYIGRAAAEGSPTDKTLRELYEVMSLYRVVVGGDA